MLNFYYLCIITIKIEGYEEGDINDECSVIYG